MYKDQEDFVKGQKIKLIIIVIILVVVTIHSLLTGEPFFK